MNLPRLPRRHFMQSLTLGAASGVLGCKSSESTATAATHAPPSASPTPPTTPAMTQPAQKADGQFYAPTAKPNPVVKPGEFVFGAAHLDHGHIYGQCNGLTEAGATLAWVYDPDPAKVADFLKKFPGTPVARSLDEILNDP